MTHILTLVASGAPLTTLIVDEAEKRIKASGTFYWLAQEKAVDIPLDIPPTPEAIKALRSYLDIHKIDMFITPKEHRHKKLLVADMDSTIVAEETLDELAAYAGIKPQIAAITQRAMNGELDFHDALRERVALLKGLPEEALAQTLAKTQLNAGAKLLVKTMAGEGATCVLVSGGFTFFTKAIAQQCGFHYNHGNTLEIENGALTGRVIEPILDKHAKVEFLNQYLEKQALTPVQAMTIGDGANDLPMLQATGKHGGLGVGYHPKPAVAKEITNIIRYGNLSAALYAQGFHTH